MIFETPSLGLTVEITQGVIDHLNRYRQLNDKDKEAGGQLFACLYAGNDLWVIEKSTGPQRRDFRSRFGFSPNRKMEQKDIDAAFARRLHFVGDWHTHPEPLPTPSIQDNKAMSDMFDRSKHQLKGFILVIVGNGQIKDLWVSIHSGSGKHEPLSLKEVQSSR